MLKAIADEFRHIVWAAALIIVCVAVVGGYVYVELHRPVQHTTPASAATAAPRDITSEIEGGVEAGWTLAASRGAAPAVAQPAASVIREVPVLSGFSAAQVAQIIAHFKAPTREVLSATSKLVGPKPTASPTPPPGWTDDQLNAMYLAARKADEDVIAQSHIATDVTATQQEVQSTRIGSMLTPSGSGLAFAAVRHGHFELDLGAIIRGLHLTPALSPEYLIPHTSVGCGPAIAFDQHVLVGAACTVHF